MISGSKSNDWRMAARRLVSGIILAGAGRSCLRWMKQHIHKSIRLFRTIPYVAQKIHNLFVIRLHQQRWLKPCQRFSRAMQGRQFTVFDVHFNEINALQAKALHDPVQWLAWHIFVAFKSAVRPEKFSWVRRIMPRVLFVSHIKREGANRFGYGHIKKFDVCKLVKRNVFAQFGKFAAASFDGNDAARRSYLARRENRVEADISAAIDHGHTGLQYTSEIAEFRCFKASIDEQRPIDAVVGFHRQSKAVPAKLIGFFDSVPGNLPYPARRGHYSKALHQGRAWLHVASIALIFLLAFACSTEASPLNWKRIAKIAIVWGAPIGSSLLAAKGTFDCRHRFGPEPCSEKYGEAKAFEVVRGGFSLTMSTISWKCLSGTGDKACYGFAMGTTAFNTAWAVHEERIHAKKD